MIHGCVRSRSIGGGPLAVFTLLVPYCSYGNLTNAKFLTKTYWCIKKLQDVVL